jgi:hypothetical protein
LPSPLIKYEEIMSMQLSPDFVFDPRIQEPESPVKTVTLTAAAVETSGPDLGPLADLPGSWAGTGFNTIWRPFHDPQNPDQNRFLELNVTDETLDIEVVQGAIPNRGLLQPDINMYGVHYLQQVSDSNTKEALHFEPGIWLNIPSTTGPQEPPTIARLGSIPHGTSILAQGLPSQEDRAPNIAVANITPFVADSGQLTPFPESDLSVTTPFRTADLTGITQDMVNDPNSVLRTVLAGQTVTNTINLIINSGQQPVAGGGTANTAFLQGVPGGAANANAAQVTAIFWIETVKGENGQPDFLQLQYTQTVMLSFAGFTWPHISVATLRKVSPTP